MSGSDIVLLGYYGRGNFGDDVLMAVTHEVASQAFPGAKLGIRLGTNDPYPERLLKTPIERIPFGTRDKHRLLIHGGGGTFFDFRQHDFSQRIFSSLLLAGGARNYVRFDNLLRRFSNRQRLSGDMRIGLGIGVGTFTTGSPKLREALPLLADFDSLWVRDNESVSNVARLGIEVPITKGSDLAFLWKHWCPERLALQPKRERRPRPRVGVILRDWPPGKQGTLAEQLKPCLDALSSRFDLTLISFDANTDAGTLASLDYMKTSCWQPQTMTIVDFAEEISKQDVLLTSRAHGAICGACLGIPSVIINIEEKLLTVHQMLPQSTRLTSINCETDTLLSLLEEALSISAATIADEVQQNETASKKARDVTIGKAHV